MTTDLEGYPLSAQQRRAWMLQRFGLPPAAQAVLGVPDVDDAVLHRSVRALCESTEILRTTYRALPGMAAPLQVIEECADVRWRSTPSRVDEICRQDLEAHDGTAAFTLVADGPNRYLVVTLSALSVDRASWRVLCDRLSAQCAGEAGAAPPVQYVDYAEWQRELLDGADGEAGLTFWRSRLSAPVLTIAGRRPLAGRPPAHLMRRIPVRMDDEWRERLFAASGDLQASPSSLLVALWQIMLRRLGAEPVGTLGCELDGRGIPGLGTAVGLFARTVPIVARADSSASVRGLVARTHEQMTWVVPKQDYAALDLVGGDAPAALRFPLAYRFEDDPAPSRDPASFRLVSCGHEHDLPELRLAAVRTGETLDLALEYDPGVVSERTIRAVSEYLPRLCTAALMRPDVSIADVEVASGGQTACFTWGRAGKRVEVAPDAYFHQVFERQARQSPDRPAVVSDKGDLTYADLERDSRRWARRLRRLGAGPDTVVAVLLDRSPAAVASVLAVLRSGAAFVAVHPDTPVARLRYMLSESRAVAVMTTSGGRQHVGRMTPVICVDEEASPRADDDGLLEPARLAPGNLAYVLFTSGSTGHPKGVMVPHGALLNLCFALREHVYGAMPPRLRVGVNAPLAFDASIKQVAQLAFGHTLVVVPNEVRTDPAAFVSFVRRHRIDVIDATPSLAALLLDTDLGIDEERPRALLLGGEVLDSAIARQLAARPNLTVFNLYGPTECTVDVTGIQVLPAEPVTIGRPLPNVEGFVLDRFGQPIVPGMCGELYVAGAGVSRGYLNDPRLTADRFVPDPFGSVPGGRLYRTGDIVRLTGDGRFEFHGRADRQVKLRGVRLELGDVEATILRHRRVKECAVIVRRGDSSEPMLVAYVVERADGDRGEAPLVDEVRRDLASWLPEVSIPAAFVVLERMPLTPNGKLDVDALPPPTRHHADDGLYVSGTEEIVAGVWQDVLQVASVDRHDDFFARGGHSLLATQAVSRIRRALACDVPLRALFECPTVAGLSARIDQHRSDWRGNLPPLVAVSRAAPLPLSFAQQRLWFLTQLNPGDTSYNCSVRIPIGGALDLLALRRALNEVGRRHESLRSSFPSTGGVPVQRIREAADEMPLPVVDLAALPAPDKACATAIARLAGRPFDLAKGPLLRLALVRLGSERVLLSMTLHHIVTDGWSLGLLVRDAMECYQAFAAGRRPKLPELPVQYADFAVWQRSWLQGPVLDAQLRHWRTALAGMEELRLPVIASLLYKPGTPARRLRCRLGAEVSADLKTVARQRSATVFMLLAGAFQLALSALTGSKDLVVGTDVANRTHTDTENIVGFFVNQLALRMRVDPRQRVADLLDAVREMVLGAYANQDVPFERVVDAVAPSRAAVRSPLFPVKLVLQNVPGRRWDRPDDGALDALDDDAAPKFDVLFNMREAGPVFEGVMQYDPARLAALTVRRLRDLFESAVERLTAEAWMQRTVGELLDDIVSARDAAVRSAVAAESVRALSAAKHARARPVPVG